MKILYSCQAEKDLKLIIEGPLIKWQENSKHINHEDASMEIQKILTRGFTSGVTFMAAFGEPGQKRVSRVFKIDQMDRALKEAKAATFLSKTIAANFFCRIQNDPEQDYWVNSDNIKLGIIEYEYAGSMGMSESVDTLIDYIYQLSKNDQLSNSVQGISTALDDVIQGLKTKVYTRNTFYNVNGREAFDRKLKHFNLDFVKGLFDKMSEDVKPLFEDPEDDYNSIDFSVGIGLNAHYTSDHIHGDLNPTNILVYSGHDRIYGTLIDFLEMELKKEEDFQPFFWDFARLEAELILSLFTKPFYDANKAPEIIEKISDSLFNMEVIDDEDKLLSAYSKILIQLRRSYFRTEGLELDIAFNTTDVLKSYFYNLLIFYISVTKFKNIPIEPILSLALAKITAKQILKVNAKWVSEKIVNVQGENKITEKPIIQEKAKKEENKEDKKSFNPVLMALPLLIILGVAGWYLLSNGSAPSSSNFNTLAIESISPKNVLTEINKAKALLDNGDYKKALSSFDSIQEKYKTDFVNSPIAFALLQFYKGKAYQQLSFNERKNSKSEDLIDKSIEAYKSALNVKGLKENHANDYANIKTFLGYAYQSKYKLNEQNENLDLADIQLKNSLEVLNDEESESHAKAKLHKTINQYYSSESKKEKAAYENIVESLTKIEKLIPAAKYPESNKLLSFYLADSLVENYQKKSDINDLKKAAALLKQAESNKHNGLVEDYQIYNAYSKALFLLSQKEEKDKNLKDSLELIKKAGRSKDRDLYSQILKEYRSANPAAANNSSTTNGTPKPKRKSPKSILRQITKSESIDRMTGTASLYLTNNSSSSIILKSVSIRVDGDRTTSSRSHRITPGQQRVLIKKIPYRDGSISWSVTLKIIGFSTLYQK